MEIYKGLTEDQSKAIECLVKGMSITDTAKEVGVSRNTIYDWKKKEEFNSILGECLAENKLQVKRKIIAKSNQLTERVLQIAMKSKSDKTSLDSCIFLINQAIGTPTNKVQEVPEEKTEENVNMDILLEELERK